MAKSKPKVRDLSTLGTKQLREEVLRRQLMVEASFYGDMYGQAENSLPAEDWAWMQGSGWTVGGSAGTGQSLNSGAGVCWGFTSEQDHRNHQNYCRSLYYRNCFGKNAINNIRFYTVGSGFTYKVAAKDQENQTDKGFAEDVQRYLEQAIEDADLKCIEREMVTRGERDGEVFVGKYPDEDGLLDLRLREPSEVQSPQGRLDGTQGEWHFGLDISTSDANHVLGFCVCGTYVDASEMKQLKLNVDGNVPRGISTLWTPKEALEDAGKALKAVTRTATIQSSIPWVKYSDATGGVVGSLLAGNADFSRTKPNGQTQYKQRIAPGTALDAPAGTKYDFPTTGVDVVKMTEAIQANLRAAASALTMPEWMLTGKLDAKYANAEISEGPTGYMIGEKQEIYTGFLREIIMDWILGPKFGERLKVLKITVMAPDSGQGQTIEEAQVSQIQLQNGVKSRSTWAREAGYDPEAEKLEIAKEDEAALGVGAPIVNPPSPPAA